MNIAIRNENITVMNYLDVEIIKTLDGLYTKEEISKEFINLYYNKVIIDITAIKNYFDDRVLFDFLGFWGPEKVILVLNNTAYCNNPSFLKKLVENGYYNFSKNASGISFLVNKPNTFEDVKKYLEVKQDLNFTNENVVDKNLTDKINYRQKIIGISNITPHAGATTLMYMMIKLLKNKYKVKGLEIGKDDSKFFNTEDIITCENIKDAAIKLNALYDNDIIIVDLNGADGKDICTETIYLMEAGTIRLNKLLKSGQNIGEFSLTHKVVLTRSAIKDSDLNTFTYETRIKVFHNLFDFNEREDECKTVKNLLIRLGIM